MTLTGRLLLLAVLVARFSSTVHAQAQPPPDLGAVAIEDLMKIVVTTASRDSEDIAAAPARVQVVTAAEIERRGYRSLLDVLKDLPEFKVDLAGDPHYPAEITVLGTRGTTRLVLLMDGIRISSPTNDPLPLMANYPVHNARQIEIVYGPASALYGADAFSAVINIISKDVTDASGLTASSSVGQFGLYNQTASYATRLGAGASLMMSGQFFHDHQPDLSRVFREDFGGLQGQRTGTFNTIFGPITPTRPVAADYDIPMSAHSVQARLHAGGLVLALFQSRSLTPTSGANTPDNTVYNAGIVNHNTLLVTSGTYTRPVGRVTSTSTFMFSRHELGAQSGYRNVYSNFERSFKYAYGTMAKAEEQLSWKPRPSISMIAGVTVERFFAMPQGADLNAPVESRDAPGTILDTTIPDDFVKLRYANTGVFAQVQYAMAPRVSLTLGARGDYNTRFGGTFNPRLGVVVHPAAHSTLKILFGTAYLAPSPYQAYAHYGAFYTTDGGRTFASSYWRVPNPDLAPQQKRTVEVNLLQSVGAGVHLSGSVFYTRFTHLIKVSDPAESGAGFYHGWPVDYIDFLVNQGHATTYGGSLGANFVRTFGPTRRLEAHAAAVLVNGRDYENEATTDGLPAGAMSPLQFRFGADLDWDRWRVAPRLSLVGTQRFLATVLEEGKWQRQTLDGYATVDVNIRRRLFTSIDAFATIENALNTRYRTINSLAYLDPSEFIGAPQNPRRVAIGFNVRIR